MPCADDTVTFARRSPGSCSSRAALRGTVEVADIGIDLAVERRAAALGEPRRRRGAWSPARGRHAQVGRRRCLVIGGTGGMTGAPMLVSHAALRAGAGIVWSRPPRRDAAARASGTEVITHVAR